MLRADDGGERAAMTRLFAVVDPLRLIAAGAPADEYEPEIDRLLRWRRPVDAALVRAAFADLTVSVADAERLAVGIAEIRTRLGHPTTGHDG